MKAIPQIIVINIVDKKQQICKAYKKVDMIHYLEFTFFLEGTMKNSQRNFYN